MVRSPMAWSSTTSAATADASIQGISKPSRIAKTYGEGQVAVVVRSSVSVASTGWRERTCGKASADASHVVTPENVTDCMSVGYNALRVLTDTILKGYPRPAS